jgi:uncharacterized protein
MGPVDGQALDRAVRESVSYGRYAQAVDRESAFEKLTSAAGPPDGHTPPTSAAAPAPARKKATATAPDQAPAPAPVARSGTPCPRPPRA